MDWELYERYRATLLIAVVTIATLLAMGFQKSSAVRHFRALLVVFTSPAERLVSGYKAPPAPAPEPVAPAVPATPTESPSTAPEVSPDGLQHAEQQRALQVLTLENKRLRELLDLKQRRWPRSIAAHVVGRDPQRWFQEVVLDKGRDDGISVDDPVVAIADGREGLVGRIVEASPRVAKVMLVQDSLSAVAATVLGSVVEDGVVEGSNGHELILKYIDRGSKCKIGDQVVTSGLGKAFPDGVPLGTIDDISMDPRQLFLQARLKPSIQTNQLHDVLVLVGRSESGRAE